MTSDLGREVHARTQGGDGSGGFDWSQVVSATCGAGVERIVAHYAAVRGFDPATRVLRLEFPEPLQVLLETGACARLQDRLRAHFGDELCLEVSYGEGAGSLADVRRHAALSECARLLHSLAESGVLVEMEAAFGARPRLSTLSGSEKVGENPAS